MSKIKLTGDTSGYVEISAPNVATNNTLELGGGTKILTNLDNVFTGVTTYSGNIDLNANLDLADNNKILIGTGDDLQIYHNGTNSYVLNNTTGDLRIEQAVDDRDIILQADNGSGGQANYLFCDGSSGRVVLSHYGSGKIETSSTGATVTGTLVSGSVTSELDLTAISSSISDTAIDVFVYDTRKDSDGGAWRKRTQHTSWYNETLNTATRGSRKEFPAVAVIVLDDLTTTGRMTIYDGDDPDLPMWMVFTGAANAQEMLPSFTSTKLVTVSALNGQICVGNNTYDLEIIDFLKDGGTRVSTGQYINNHNISTRNSALQSSSTSTGSGLIDRAVNDVAMTVLPNALIDDVTGLPVPTIAVGTNDGVSFIKDDGTVMSTGSSSGGYPIKKVDFTDDHGLNAHIDSNSGGNKGLVYVDNFNKLNGLSYGTYANWDGVLYANRYAANVLTYRTPGNGSAYPVSDFISMSGTDAAVGSNFTDGGLTLLAKNNESTGQGMVAFVTSDFNTGYQQGDIKGAFLSDTDTTNITSGEILSNGDFTNGTTGWTLQDAGEGSISVSSNQLTLNNSTSSDPPVACYQQISLEVGKYYNVESNRASGLDVVVNITTGTSNGGGTGGYGNVIIHTSNGDKGATFLATAATMYCYIRVNTNATGTAVMNSVSIRKAEEDRSINNSFSRDKTSALTIHGTVTKSAVATGADLVGYSGFSASNHLAQPYNSNLDPGSGSYSVVAWFKTESSGAGSGVITGLGNGDTDEVMLVYVASSYGIYFDYGTSTEYVYLSNSGDRSMVRDGNWHQVVCQVTAGQIGEIYVDGIKRSTAQNVAAPSTWSQWDTNYRLYIGCGRGLGTLPFSGSISLVRYSLSKMSPEQVKKMYDDEKHLFVENAKCTLYGSSDAVTALAYDEDTELLHVGTSAGRSDFQGLRRINNTTTAVTTAISASDELIAEQ